MTAACISVNNKDMSGFVADILGRGAGLQLRVTGKSMAPAICSGDVVAVEKTPPDALRLGDLIFYRKGERLVLHRILFAQHAGDHTIVFRTKGDAARSLDEPVQPGQVLGRGSEIHHKDRAGKWHCRDMASSRWKIFNRLIALQHLFGLVFSSTFAGLKRSSETVF
jgi:signal peptidase I